MRSKRLARQLKKTFEEAALEANLPNYMEAAKALPDSEGAQGITKLLQNLPEFLDMVDETYAQLEEKVNLAQRSLEISSKELTEANKSLFGLNQTFDTMINSLGQGFLMFGPDGVCLSTYSKVCEKLLESNPAGRAIGDVLKIPTEKRATFDAWVRIVFDERLDFEDAMMIGPKLYPHSEGLTISLDYKEVRDGEGKLILVVLIATDRTQEVRAQKLAQEMQSYARMVVCILKDKNRFRQFIAESRKMLTELRELANAGLPCAEDVEIAKRHLHTLKGAAATFGMIKLTDAIHGVESDLGKRIKREETLAVLQKAVPEIDAIFETTLAQNREIIGEDCLDATPKREFSVEFLRGYAVLLQSMDNRDEIYGSFVSQFLAVPLRELFSRYDAVLQQTAELTGKKVYPIRFSGEEISIIPEAYESVLSVLPHVFRNLVDHGIESETIRRERGKSPAGTVRVEFSSVLEAARSMVEISIRDDGSGIDVDRIREKLVKMNRSAEAKSASPEQLMDKIFESGFSTAEKVSDISGRGVGLDAVRAAVMQLGGTIRVESELGKGARFLIRLPATSKLVFGVGSGSGLQPLAA